MTCHFNLRRMISVHVSALFKQTSHYGGNQYHTHFKRLFITRSIRKNVDVQLYAKNTLDWRKIKMVNAPLRIQQIIHLTRLDCSFFHTWFGKFSDMIEENIQQ